METADLREYLQMHLPHYMVPTAIVVIDEIPMTPSRKVDLKRLPAPATDRGPAAAADPRTGRERELAEHWCTVLVRESVGLRDNFFLLGGHSLQIMRIIAHVRESYGIDIPLAGFLEQPTVEALAARIETEIDAPAH